MNNEILGWACILASVAMGLWMGIRFQQENWLGGYGTLSRRMVRLAHIALAALGILNIEFGRSAGELALSAGAMRGVSIAFMVAAISMPACCLLIAAKVRRFEIFAIPVVSLAAGVLFTIGGLVR
jgi:hypothetical protein